MGDPKQGASFLEEFKQFLQFLQSLWAILAGISVLFPLSNALVKIIPLARWPEGGLAFFSPELVSIISTLACLFIVLWTFGRRHQFGRKQRQIRRTAGMSFFVGVAALVIYLSVQYAVAGDFYFDVLGLESGSLLRVFGDVVLLIVYCAFFVFVTRAFMLLGMLEYFGRRNSTA